jgi:hypothetical protein
MSKIESGDDQLKENGEYEKRYNRPYVGRVKKPNRGYCGSTNGQS